MAHPHTQERPGQKERTIFFRVQLHFTHFVQHFIEFHADPLEIEVGLKSEQQTF